MAVSRSLGAAVQKALLQPVPISRKYPEVLFLLIYFMLLCLNLEKGRNGNGGGGKRRVRWDLCEEVDTEDKREYDWVEKKKTDFRK